MNVFIVFVRFLGWIVIIWIRLASLIGEKRSLRFWKGSPTTKIKYTITIYIYIYIKLKKKLDLGLSLPKAQTQTK